MLNLFRPKPVLEEAASQWLFDSYAWAFSHFGSDIFHEDTVLVTPTNRHFPDKADNANALATNLFERIKTYAGMQAWPCQILPASCDSEPPPAGAIQVQGAPRGPACSIAHDSPAQRLTVSYDPGLMREPERLAALLAHELALLLSRTTNELPPGGEAYRSHAADVLAIFMGFGLFYANHAITLGGGGCGGCKGGPKTLGSLMEDEMTYALAIFSVLKGLQDSEVMPYLKKPLRPLYKKAVKEIATNSEQLNRLRSIDCPIKSH